LSWERRGPDRDAAASGRCCVRLKYRRRRESRSRLRAAKAEFRNGAITAGAKSTEFAARAGERMRELEKETHAPSVWSRTSLWFDQMHLKKEARTAASLTFVGAPLFRCRDSPPSASTAPATGPGCSFGCPDRSTAVGWGAALAVQIDQRQWAGRKRPRIAKGSQRSHSTLARPFNTVILETRDRRV
jgi:hypothetical protein